MFTDCQMAYGKIIITRLRLAISMMGFPQYIRKTGQISNRISYIQICNQTPTSFYSNNGLKQGNVLATPLYSRAFDMTLQQAKCNLIAVILNKSHTVLAYVDSIVTLG